MLIQESPQHASIHRCNIVSSRCIRPTNTSREVLFFLDSEEVDGTIHIAGCDNVVWRDKRFQRDDLRSLLKVEEHVDEAGVEA